MTKGSSSAEAPLAGRRARWLVIAGAPALLALAAARGLDPARASAPDAVAVTARSVMERAPVPEPLAEPLPVPSPTAQEPAPTAQEQPPQYSEPPPLLSDPRRPSVVPLVPPPPSAPVVAAPSPPSPSLAPAPPQAEPSPEPPECVPTPLTSTALAEVLREGHIRHFGVPPHADRWACAWAHCAFEQDRGGAIYSNNLGHITAPVPPGSKERPAGRVCRRRMRERLTKGPDRWALVDMWFRVFETPEEGAEAYWRLLANSYYSVIARCDNGDPRGAAQRLAEIGYFTGPEQPYIDGMARLFVSARGKLIPRLMAAHPLAPATDPSAP